MNAARWRLVALVAVLVTAVVLFTTTDLVDAAHLRDRIGATGAWAPLVYVPVSAVLGALLVPGPLLAGISGVLFGPVTGTVATIASAVLSALIARSGGRRAGRPGVEDLLGERAAPLAVLSRRYGTAAVLGQRLAPGVPDAPLSWAFGALGCRCGRSWWGPRSGRSRGRSPTARSGRPWTTRPPHGGSPALSFSC